MGNKKYKQKHLELGLCVECSNIAEFNSTRCSKHNEARKKYYLKTNKTRVEYRKKNNLCSHCAKPLNPDTDESYSCCFNCRSNLYRRKTR